MLIKNNGRAKEDNKKYYGCENPEAVSYLEFGAINIVKGQKTIWNYWQDQMAYDLYMFARYSKDLFAFRHFFEEEIKTPETLNKYVLNAAHNKLLDYIFKYAGLLAVNENAVICESGSSLYGWIDEAIACDYVYNAGENVEKIKQFEYICSDISRMMNEGAKEFHKDIKMKESLEDTIVGLIDDVNNRLNSNIDLFYGVSVSIRYAVRQAYDLVKMAKQAQLSIFNRLSLTYEDSTKISVYGSGKSVYTVSLKELVEELEKENIFAKYCEANMQVNKDGNDTIRVSVAIAKDTDILDKFIYEYERCVDKSLGIKGVEKGQWKDLRTLLKNNKE